MIDIDEIRAAARRIEPHVLRTPVMAIGADYFGHNQPVAVKLEQLQKTGSFKARGAFNALLSQEVPAAGVAAASGGNHGLAVACAAARLGHRARIFVPKISSPAKISRIQREGAELVIGGATYADALAACEAYIAESGALSIHAYDADATIAGQGTVALEWEAQVDGLDTVLVAVGGGGLISGIARWFAGRVKVVGVEPRTSCCLHAALAAGQPVDVLVSGLAADSLGARNCGPRVFEIASKYVDHVVLVEDTDIAAAQTQLWGNFRLMTEPGGAAAFAALAGGAYRPKAGERVGVLICGANVDPGTLADDRFSARA